MSARTVGHIYAVREGKQLRVQVGGVPNEQQFWPISGAGRGTNASRAKVVSKLIVIAQREGDITSILLPALLLPYDATAVTFDSGIKMLREGQIWDVYDIQAYGASTDGTDALTAINTAASHANTRGSRLVWHPPGTYTVSTNPTFPGSTVPVGDGAAYSGSTTTIYSLALDTTASGGGLTVPGDILPSVTATYDIGSTSLKWRDGWFSRNLSVGAVASVTTRVNIGSGTPLSSSNHLLNLSHATVPTVVFDRAADYAYLYYDGTYLTLASSVGATGAKLKVHKSAADDAVVVSASGTAIAGTLTATSNVGLALGSKIYLDGVAMAGSVYISTSIGSDVQIQHAAGKAVYVFGPSGNKGALAFWDANKAVFISGTAGDPTTGGDYINVSGFSGVLLRAGGAYTAATEVARFTSGATSLTGTLAVTGTSTLTGDLTATGTTTTFGPGSTGTATTSVNVNSGNGAGGSPQVVLQRNGARGGLIGVSGSAGGVIAGSASGDFCVRGTNAVLFSADDGTTMQGALYGTRGTWSFGNKSSTVATSGTAIGYFRHDFGALSGDGYGVLAVSTASLTSNGGIVAAGVIGSVNVGGSSDATTSTANWTATVGVRAFSAQLQTRTGSSGTITGMAAYVVESLVKNGTNTITNYYGVYCEAQTAATNNYFLYNAGAANNVLGTGNTSVGGTLTVTTSISVNGGDTSYGKVAVAAAGRGFFSNNSTNPGYALTMYNGGTSQAPSIGSAGNDITFYAGGADPSTTERVRFTSGGLVLIGTTLTTGISAGEVGLANNKAIRWVNQSGSTSADFGIMGEDNNFIRLMVPAADKRFSFFFGGTLRGYVVSENSGMGIWFVGESSADHSAPPADGAVMFTKDNGAGKTQLCVRFASGATQVVATQP